MHYLFIPVHLSNYLPINLYIFPSIHPPIYPFSHLSILPSGHPFDNPSIPLQSRQAPLLFSWHQYFMVPRLFPVEEKTHIRHIYIQGQSGVSCSTTSVPYSVWTKSAQDMCCVQGHSYTVCIYHSWISVMLIRFIPPGKAWYCQTSIRPARLHQGTVLLWSVRISLRMFLQCPDYPSE